MDETLGNGLQELPEGWKYCSILDLANVKYGKAKPKDLGVIPVIGSGGVYGFTIAPSITFPTIVIGRKGTAGMAWLCKDPCWPSDTTFYLDWKERPFDIRFIYHCLQHRPLSGQHSKTTIPSLQKSDLENYVIPFPPPPEQQVIAQVLRTVQRAKEATEKVIAAAKQLKQSLMRHLFTYGPVPFPEADQVELKETDYGTVPDHWQVKPLGQFITLQRGFDLPAHKRIRGTVPVVSSSGVSGLHSESKVVGPGVITGRYGTLGKVYYIKDDFWPLNTTLFVKRFGGNDPRFVQFFLMTLSMEAFNDKTSVPGINRNHLHAVKVGFPAPQEQKAIANILVTVEQKLVKEESKAEMMGFLFHSLLHHLMTGQLRAHDLDLPTMQEVA
jgi:type I restriction enzyme, S subunit